MMQRLIKLYKTLEDNFSNNIVSNVKIFENCNFIENAWKQKNQRLLLLIRKIRYDAKIDKIIQERGR